ncbi:PilD [Desulforapulum autotrophicum HRM2]|uniref:Prepilin leader peptidase/N-methyltransferase n=1 Tax=Desulforapulum autotrophicum (strain ATCC 43914 / DSM 3382 / VKM B-1955 / HRM2) TaxID=177437 RepID=C0QKN4_DESAH|nr:A24 family peptidase [Desulforapulum autotrophicum]ACN16124.1 PilD [Desulforapulum autotrophicum HRM2]
MTIPMVLTIIIFFTGACIGSFLNVCIYRIPLHLSIVWPGSACPRCKTPLPFYLNIPILSYILIRGKCRFCHAPISIRYPLVEALTGFLALAVTAKFGITPATLFYFTFAATLVVISFIDIDFQIIPDIISLPGILVFASASVFIPRMDFMDTILGIVAGGGTLYLVALVYYLIRKEEGMGGGDIKLLAMIGGVVGWQGVAFTLFAGSLMGTAGGVIIMVLTRLGDVKLKIPFGPFLSAGSLVYIFFGEPIINWYFSLL